MGIQETLGIEIIEVKKGYAALKLEITEKVLQPFGYLHGGVSVLLAEHAASLGASHSIATDEIAFGLEINANHLASKQSGEIVAVANCVHDGKTTQVWQIDLIDEGGRKICVSRATLAVKKKH
ncbi:1,4-dihydroxy-2-naphthoyl-CoA hydrolase MenI [Listeria sp. PSOL-1]|uniref:1,4-dihydroxy-2-naphthoyl-CoA hydrolase MenI n=1 Tax=Listeria sp. PSOL-1 TaxID=1844999 RepID=UPI0013D51019|nr:PaaI family thioesterase [Listeria sp. PSOL-1]